MKSYCWRHFREASFPQGLGLGLLLAPTGKCGCGRDSRLLEACSCSKGEAHSPTAIAILIIISTEIRRIVITVIILYNMYSSNNMLQ